MKASILHFLKTHGEELDANIAKALHMSLELVTDEVAQLSSAGEVVCCSVTRFVNGKRIEGVSCRLSHSPPPRAPGPKPGAKREAAPD